MTKWITAQQASKKYGVSTKTIHHKGRRGQIARKQIPGRSGMYLSGGKAYAYSEEDCKKHLKVSGERTENDKSLARLIMYSPWTRAGLRELSL